MSRGAVISLAEASATYTSRLRYTTNNTHHVRTSPRPTGHRSTSLQRFTIRLIIPIRALPVTAPRCTCTILWCVSQTICVECTESWRTWTKEERSGEVTCRVELIRKWREVFLNCVFVEWDVYYFQCRPCTPSPEFYFGSSWHFFVQCCFFTCSFLLIVKAGGDIHLPSWMSQIIFIMWSSWIMNWKLTCTKLLVWFLFHILLLNLLMIHNYCIRHQSSFKSPPTEDPPSDPIIPSPLDPVPRPIPNNVRSPHSPITIPTTTIIITMHNSSNNNNNSHHSTTINKTL